MGGARRPQEPLGSLDIPWCSVKREALIVQRLLAQEAAKRGMSVAALGDGDGDITSGAIVPDQTVSEGVIRLSPKETPLTCGTLRLVPGPPVEPQTLMTLRPDTVVVCFESHGLLLQDSARGILGSP